MLPQLTDVEARIIGCLMEKSVVTPEQYPLTLNALTSACNQKSARDPVMALKQNEVQRAARQLKDKSLLQIEENFKTGMEKYKQRLCNTHFNDFYFDPPQFAIVCLLLLRGAQTPGELRARSPRLHAFADNTAVVDALAGLLDSDSGPLVVKLPRTPGRKDAEYSHQLCGHIDVETHASQMGAAEPADTAGRAQGSGLAGRVSDLEAEVAELRAQLQTLL